ncbi:tRNA1(Val) (adenine(37)-N6)-methyltransferase [Tellurirhabdus rosea]|uniref:tRNA1(Val) (adenine(37)-N6)-methyltransferase n=1 Tax=Tellurirhabdus rosea TaxID=2674997 RepID=UPI0022593FE5|nr:methyltransferase [Tellurirhabdus rosea]
MKVCTDACTLGAYADVAGQRVLDIGTGTGLLALMAAQRNPQAVVDAVEVDEAAFGQALENVAASPFADRVRVHHGRIQAYDSAAPYDRILTNPPFYTAHLRSPDRQVARALHNDELPFSELLEAAGRLLKPDGQLWVLLPPFEMERLVAEAAGRGLSIFRELRLRHHAQKPVFRHICGFSFANLPAATEELAIYETDNRTYTEPFRRLLGAYYLIF